MIDELNLLPCPFCGGTEAFVERLNYSAAYVQCDSSINEHDACLARGPIGVQEDDDEDIPGEAAAIKAWNEQAARRSVPVSAPMGTNGEAIPLPPLPLPKPMVSTRHGTPCYTVGQMMDHAREAIAPYAERIRHLERELELRREKS